MIDLIITNALTRFSPDIAVDIAIHEGKIIGIAKNLSKDYLDAKQKIDAKHQLVTESFINGHLHLCKVYTLERAGQKALSNYHKGGMSSALTAIEDAAAFKDQYDATWIIENVRKALDLAIKYGNTHIRAFADVDSKAKLEGIKALLQAKEEYKNKVDLEIVAFPQDGLLHESGAKELVEEALQLGADIVGGIPWIEHTQEEEQEHIDIICNLAEKYDKNISMLLDDVGDAEERTLEMLCKRIIKMNFQGRATAQHCRAMSLYGGNYKRKLFELIKQADIGIVTDPHTGPLHVPVDELLNADIPIALGMDDIADAYYPFGDNNMLQVAFLASHLLWMTTFEDLESLYDMITTKAAQVLGINNHRLEVGGNADLVILKQPNIYHAIWQHEAPAYVIKNGIVIN